MTEHHPNTDMLMDYSAGSLDFGQSLCVSVHLEHCLACRDKIMGLDTLGAEMLTRLEPVAPSQDSLAQVLAAIDAPGIAHSPVIAKPTAADVPRPLVKLIPDGIEALPWRRVNSDLQTVVFEVGERQHQVSLIRMAPGGTISEHRHAGTELTVVLQGGFSDHAGVYRAGDFVALGEEDRHQPIAHQNEDCICLTAQDAPIQFTGAWSRMLNPFLRVHPQ